MGNYDVIIIGAGPAGMTAALYCARAGVRVALIEKDYIPGGQMNNAVLIENYPGAESMSGADLAREMYLKLEKYSNIDFIADEVTMVEDFETDGSRHYIVNCKHDNYFTDAVIEAIGMEHMTLPNTEDLDFVHYCATCDGPLYREEPVAVIGDGNTAISYALELSKYCSTVYLFTLTKELFGEEINNRLLRQTNNIIQIVGSASLGRGKPFGSYVRCNEEKYPVAAAFVAIGMKHRELPIAEGTDLSGYFKAGDCNTNNKFHQVSLAVGDGTRAALEALEWIRQCSLK